MGAFVKMRKKLSVAIQLKGCIVMSNLPNVKKEWCIVETFDVSEYFDKYSTVDKCDHANYPETRLVTAIH